MIDESESFDTELSPRGTSVRSAVVLAVVAVVAFSAGVFTGGHASANVLSNVPLIGDGLDATPDRSADLTDFWKAWNALDANFVQAHASTTLPTTEEKVWGAIKGLTASYKDPYTVFMPPADAKQFQEDIAGNFGGVGMEIGIDKNNVLAVIAPLKDTPAEKAGMKSGDEIVSIDGKSTDGMSTDTAVKTIRGPKGTTVTFTVLRAGKMLTIPVVRDVIQVPEIDYSLDKATGVYGIALYEFSGNSAELFDKAFADFKTSGSKKLVIDLRGNPGGFLDAAVDIASHFLASGTTVVTEDYKGKQENLVHRSTGTNDVPPGTKVVILIDQGSASASEILSGALHDNNVATLIGTRSFGKGSVQQLIDIGSASLKVTVARWLTPAGVNISEGGITPDVKVEETSSDLAAGKDTQKLRAIEFLTTGK